MMYWKIAEEFLSFCLWGLAIVVMVLIVEMVQAEETTGAAAAEIHVLSFEMYDDSGFGFEFGRYESGTGACEWGPPPDYPAIVCKKNGWFHVDLSEGDWDLTAKYWFHGPAFDRDGNPIAGTEDDLAIITLMLLSSATIGHFDLTYHVVNMTITGSSIAFANTVPINGLSLNFALFENQIFARGELYFIDGNQGYIAPIDGPMGMMWDNGFQIHYMADIDGDLPAWGALQAVPVPEPAFALSLALGVGLLVAVGRRGKSTIRLVNSQSRPRRPCLT